MAFFPKIQSPCPYKSRLASVMDGDMCRMCKRQVIDLGAMAEDEMRAFFAGCADEVCVSYTFPLRPALAAAALAAAALPTAAAAQDMAMVVPDVSSLEMVAMAGSMDMEMAIIVGGIKDPGNVQFVEDPTDGSVPELPVAYEDGQDPQPAASPAPAQPAGAHAAS